MKVNKKRKIKESTLITVPLLVFVLSMLLSFLIVQNYENLYVERNAADMVTTSESLGSQLYDAMMKHFSCVYSIKSLIESSNGKISDYSKPIQQIVKNSNVYNVIIAKDGIVSNVYPVEGNELLLSRSFSSDFPETVDIDSLIEDNCPYLIGPYPLPDGKRVLGAVAPAFKLDEFDNRVLDSLVCVNILFPDTFDEINFKTITDRGFSYKIWRINNSTGYPQSIFSSTKGNLPERNKDTMTFRKQYFISTWYISLSPLKKFTNTPFFYFLAFLLLLVCVLFTFAGYTIVDSILTAEKRKLYVMQEELLKIQEHTIFSLSNLVENRDSDTGNHVRRTSDYVVLLAQKAQKRNLYTDLLTDEYIKTLGNAAPMHDIGKIVISDVILKKPGRLTPDEFEQIKLHTTEGERIIQDIIAPVQTKIYTQVATEIAVGHHEKWNGTGYPYGLQGYGIPLSARIMAIADVFDALTTPRCYKEPFSFEKASDIIKENKGIQFDPDLVEIFLSCEKEFKSIMEKYQV